MTKGKNLLLIAAAITAAMLAGCGKKESASNDISSEAITYGMQYDGCWLTENKLLAMYNQHKSKSEDQIVFESTRFFRNKSR